MRKFKLIKEYPGSLKLGSQVLFSVVHQIYNYNGGNFYSELPKHQVENLPEFWKEVVEKDYEILSLVHKEQNRILLAKDANIDIFLECKLDYNYWSIHSIKRLSDGEIFTVGDKCSPIGKYRDNIHSITKIWFCNPGYLRLSSNNYTLGIKDIQKVKIPLFTSEDGVNIFKGDKIYSIDRTKLIFKDMDRIIKSQYFERSSVYKYFSTKEKAEEYIFMNKPCLSIVDVWQSLMLNDAEILNPIAIRLKEKVKDKINGTE